MKLPIMTSRLTWRKSKPVAAKPKPTDSERSAAFAQLEAIESRRAEVDQLRQQADELRVVSDKAKAASDTARQKFSTARSLAWQLSCSLDGQKSKAEGVLLRSSSSLINEFCATIRDLQSGLQTDGVHCSRLPDGKFTMDSKPHKSSFSTFQTSADRARALTEARRTAESLRLVDLDDDELSSRLQVIFDALPQVGFAKC